MKIIQDSHLDHGLSEAQRAYIAQRFAERDGFFVETFDLPEELGTVPCGLYGPLVDDDPIPETVVVYARRGVRAGESRMVYMPPRPSRKMTVIAGPHDGQPCILYSAFGGPLAPREPFEPGLSTDEVAASKRFWREHALAIGSMKFGVFDGNKRLYEYGLFDTAQEAWRTVNDVGSIVGAPLTDPQVGLVEPA